MSISRLEKDSLILLQQLQELHRQGLLNDLAVHFARLMARLDGSDAPELLLGACLVSHWTGNGHVCVDLNELAGQPLLAGLDAPPLGQWLKALRTSSVVGRSGDYRPLVLDEHGRLYLYRYWAYERQLAEDLLARANAVPDIDVARLRAGLNTVFAAQQDDARDWQKLAAAAALLKRLCIISGGPGTGKTTTVIRILALLAWQGADAPLRIALAAPTGKAAARMQEAIRLAKQDLDPALADAIPEETSTLHRLLGARPDSVYFRHHRNHPLPVDVLVVDEASMVDLALMAKTVAALPPHARLILLGDKDQLASVEAGAVLGDICGEAPGFSESFRATIQALIGEAPPAAAPGDSPLQDCIVSLRRSYRFGAASGIGHLARAVNQGQAGVALELLEADRFADLAWRPLTSALALYDDIKGRIEAGFRPYLQCIAGAAAPSEVFTAFNRFRVLCAHRHGPTGVQSLNQLIENTLQAQRLINARSIWYLGRPVMVTRNDYNLRLFNGDIGIALPDPEVDGRLRVFFQTTDGGLRRFPPTRLPEHETVYAMTVHKSQGSEFDHVLMVLPLQASRILTRELLYTGITRARDKVEIWGNAAVFKAAVACRLRRSSGLRDRLWGDL